MSAHIHAKAPDADRRRAHLQYVWALRQLTEYVLTLAAQEPHTDPHPGEHLRAAARLKHFVTEVAATATIVECAEGTPWRELARHYYTDRATAQAHYGDMFRRWLHGDPAPWRPKGVPGCGAPFPADVDEAARILGRLVLAATSPQDVDGCHE